MFCDMQKGVTPESWLLSPLPLLGCDAAQACLSFQWICTSLRGRRSQGSLGSWDGKKKIKRLVRVCGSWLVDVRWSRCRGGLRLQLQVEVGLLTSRAAAGGNEKVACCAGFG